MILRVFETGQRYYTDDPFICSLDSVSGDKVEMVVTQAWLSALRDEIRNELRPVISEAKMLLRRIDDKFWIDTDGIIHGKNPDDTIPADEPLFLIRARDKLAVRALTEYFSLCVEDGCTSYQLESLHNVIENFAAWQALHPTKQPGITRGL